MRKSAVDLVVCRLLARAEETRPLCCDVHPRIYGGQQRNKEDSKEKVGNKEIGLDSTTVVVSEQCTKVIVTIVEKGNVLKDGM